MAGFPIVGKGGLGSSGPVVPSVGSSPSSYVEGILLCVRRLLA